MQGFNGNPPVNVGDEVDVKVEAVGEKGDGIIRIKGFVIFVPGVKQGENIRIRVNKVLSKVGFGEKIGDAQAPIQEETQEAPEEEVEPDAEYEDTEDFGEDDEESEEDKQ